MEESASRAIFQFTLESRRTLKTKSNCGAISTNFKVKNKAEWSDLPTYKPNTNLTLVGDVDQHQVENATTPISRPAYQLGAINQCCKIKDGHPLGIGNTRAQPLRMLATIVTLYRSSPYWFHWTAVWQQLHVSIVHVNACSFALSQASDLALLVGYVAKEDFNFKLIAGVTFIHCLQTKSYLNTKWRLHSFIGPSNRSLTTEEVLLDFRSADVCPISKNKKLLTEKCSYRPTSQTAVPRKVLVYYQGQSGEFPGDTQSHQQKPRLFSSGKVLYPKHPRFLPLPVQWQWPFEGRGCSLFRLQQDLWQGPSKKAHEECSGPGHQRLIYCLAWDLAGRKKAESHCQLYVLWLGRFSKWCSPRVSFGVPHFCHSYQWPGPRPLQQGV